MLAYAKTLQLKKEVTVGLYFTISILHFYKLVYAIALYNLNIQNILKKKLVFVVTVSLF